ncbi:acetyltransferase [Cryobacterium fucosi]|uniref:Acetyltransferase n=1 Tax=Cryobacterium fucosi TaxID=1259157 RepID=A0A4R9B554_9MICO|nr:acetyltransferase [Cryobacterium fucosi]
MRWRAGRRPARVSAWAPAWAPGLRRRRRASRRFGRPDSWAGQSSCAPSSV